MVKSWATQLVEKEIILHKGYIDNRSSMALGHSGFQFACRIAAQFPFRALPLHGDNSPE